MCLGKVQRVGSNFDIGADDAVRNRVKCVWGKFRELAQILTLRGVSLKLKGKIYVACVQSVMVYESATWAVKVSTLQQLKRTKRTMVRWMCGVTTKDRKRVQTCGLFEHHGGRGTCKAW